MKGTSEMFDWSKVTSNTAVHCTTEKECADFLKECEKRGIKWYTGEKATEGKIRKGPKCFYPLMKRGMEYDSTIEYSNLLTESEDE